MKATLFFISRLPSSIVWGEGSEEELRESIKSGRIPTSPVACSGGAAEESLKTSGKQKYQQGKQNQQDTVKTGGG